jgi:hypothetical protein
MDYIRLEARCGSISTELGCPGHVRFIPGSDRIADVAGGPVRAKNTHSALFDHFVGARARTLV